MDAHQSHQCTPTQTANEKQVLKSYWCRCCQLEFSTDMQLLKHISAVHVKDRKYQCSQCNDNFVTWRKLTKHSASHGRKGMVKCEESSEIAMMAGNKSPEINKYECTVCKDSFPVRIQYDLHMRTHTRTKSYNCRNCKQSFSKDILLLKHVSLVHVRGKLYHCSQCTDTFVTWKKLVIHSASHDYKGKRKIPVIKSENDKNFHVECTSDSSG